MASSLSCGRVRYLRKLSLGLKGPERSYRRKVSRLRENCGKIKATQLALNHSLYFGSHSYALSVNLLFLAIKWKVLLMRWLYISTCLHSCYKTTQSSASTFIHAYSTQVNDMAQSPCRLTPTTALRIQSKLLRNTAVHLKLALQTENQNHLFKPKCHLPWRKPNVTCTLSNKFHSSKGRINLLPLKTTKW